MTGHRPYPSTGALVGTQMGTRAPGSRGPQPREKVVNVSQLDVARATHAMNLQMLENMSSEDAEAAAWELYPDPQE